MLLLHIFTKALKTQLFCFRCFYRVIGETMLNNNINAQQLKQLQTQFQAMTPEQQEQLRQQVAMQAGVSPENLKENIQDTYVSNRVANTTEDPKGMLWTALLAPFTWLGIAKGMDKYAEHCRGDFETTIPGKIGAWSDNVSEKLGKNSFVRSINKGFTSARKFVRTKIIDKSAILRAFADTPSQPELPMVRDQARGMIGVCATDWDQVVENFVRETHYPEDLRAYGATADEIKNYKSTIGKLPKAQQFEELQKAEFELLKKNSRGGNNFLTKTLSEFKALGIDERKQLLRDAKTYEFGLKDFAEFEYIKKNRPDNLHRIMESSHNANKKMCSVAYEAKPSLFGRFKRFLFGREVYGSEFANKMASSIGNETLTPEMAKALKDTGLDKKIPKSALGKFLTKYNNIILEGATNRVAGGKFIAIAQAWFLAEAIYKSAKAEGGVGEKARTFAERFTELIAMFACIPPALMLMHKVGGLQYIGMTKDQVAKYRRDLLDFNSRAMSGTMSDTEYIVGKHSLNKQLKAGVKNPIAKLLKRVGRIVTVGLEQIRPLDTKKVVRKTYWEKVKDLFRHPKFGLKQMAGYPMRIILGMLIIMPFFSKLAVKGCHAIFGKPKNSVLDEGKEPEAEQKPEHMAQNPSQVQVPQQLQNPQQQPAQEAQAQKPARTYIPSSTGVNIFQDGKNQTNLLNKYKDGNVPQNQNAQTNPNTHKEPLRTYIPSPAGINVAQKEDLTGVDSAMRRANNAEQQALETLKMT